MAKALRILFLSSEVNPFAKTGGLADVAGSLPKALKRMGCDIRVAMPYYRMAKKGNFNVRVLLENVELSLFGEVLKDDIFFLEADGGIPIYLINKDEYFDREYLYGTPKGDYFDNVERFVYFSRMAFLLCKRLDFQPHVFHCNDWQTGLVPPYLKTMFKEDPFFSGTSSLFTIHNIAYQGLFPKEDFSRLGLPWDLYTVHGLEFWGKVSFMKAGILLSDAVSTVSHKYSQEIQTAEFGYGLEDILAERKDVLFGIPNGIDIDEWDPNTDGEIPANYSIEKIAGKKRCKRARNGIAR